MMREDQWPLISRLETRGASAWTKRNKGSGEFMALKRPGKKKKPAKKFKGVRTERTAKKKTGAKKKT